MGPFAWSNRSGIRDIPTPASEVNVVGIRVGSFRTNPVVKLSVVAWAIFLAKNHMVIASRDSGPIDPSHRGVNTAGAHSKIVAGQVGANVGIVRSSAIALPGSTSCRSCVTVDKSTPANRRSVRTSTAVRCIVVIKSVMDDQTGIPRP